MLPARVRRFLVRLALPALLAGLAHAQAPAPEASGTRTYYDDQTRETVVSGHARLVYGATLLTADEIRYNAATQVASARGRFVLTSGSRRLIADEGRYNLATRQLQVRNLRLGEFPVYLSGETAEGTMSADGGPEQLELTNAVVFFREDAAYTPSVRAARLVYARGKIIRAEGLRIGLHGGHFLSLPHFEQSLAGDFVSHLSAKVGYRGRLGALAELTAHLPLAPGFMAGAGLGLYSSRGVMVGPSAYYDRDDGARFVSGTLRTGYIHDSGDRRTDILGDPVPRDRSFVTWEHRQRVGPRLTLDGRFNYWSDSEVLRDFRHEQFDRVQQPDSFLEAAYAFDNSALSAFARFHPNPYHRVAERLPELRYDQFTSPLALGVYDRFAASAALLEADAYGADPAWRTHRLDAYYGVERPFAPTRWFTFTPVAGGRVTSYTDARGGRDTYTRTLGEVGFDARLRASGRFDYKNEVWEIDGLRHLVEPALSYRYAPEADDGRPYLPPIDRRAFSTYLQPLSIADTRAVDELEALHTLRLQLGNTLQTRDRTYGSRNLASLDFAADYRFDRLPGQRPLSDLYTTLALTPAPWLRWEVFHRLDLHTPGQQELNTGLELADQEWWSVRLATHFLKQDYEEYFLEYRQRLNEVFDVTGLWRYDATNSRFNEQSYGVWQRLGQTWAVKYEVSFFDGPRRESSFAFNVEVELLRF
ncbi:MAG: LPS assembly protein LptD [Opitutaceae bacterium]|nr:LPS assembly protein LptD [Opitutaceae bacterium]